MTSATPPIAKPNLRKAKQALTRDRLRHGARTLFAEKPFLTATIDDIAIAAGVGRATFYLHYASKEALLRDLLAEDMSANHRLYERLSSMGHPPEPVAVRRWVLSYMKAFRDRRASLSLFNLVIGTDPGFLSVILKERDALFDHVGENHSAFRFGEDASGRARRMGAHLLVFKIEQFCAHVASCPWDGDIEAGISILVGDLQAFLTATQD